MVSVDFSNNTPPGSPRTTTRTGTSLLTCCRIVLISAGLVALVKIVNNGSQMDALVPSIDTTAAIYKHTTSTNNMQQSSSSLRSLQLLQQEYGDTCRYYLAESAIPNGGLGVFTTSGILPNRQVGEPDLCIMVEHMPSYRETQLHSHTWGSANVFGQFETLGKGKTKAACEGLATLYNAAPKHLANIYKGTIRQHTNGGLSRKTHPGAGSISHYYGMTATSRDVIPAGSELTVDYGDWDFDQQNNDEEGSGGGVSYTKPKRSVEWIHQHGLCVDNIHIDLATSPEMGRGAFATRFLQQGSLVAPAPLQLTRHYRSAAVFDYDSSTEPEPLFVNYNFVVGDMLLFPYGPGINLINHSSQNPNVGLRWSSSPFHHSEWLELSKDELWKQAKPGGLILEVFALRDIQPGEELFLDYGDDWERAWTKHVQEWKPLPAPAATETAKTSSKSTNNDTMSYTYPAEMDETAPLRTVEEQKSNPYPSNLMTVCQTPDEKRNHRHNVKWKEPRHEFPFRMLVCYVMERNLNKHGDYVYTVALDWDGYEFDESIPDEKRYLDWNVPRRAIRFVDKPNMSDQHLRNGFRHPIELPKELVPETWKTDL